MSNQPSPERPKNLGKGPEFNIVATFSSYWLNEEKRWAEIELGFWSPDTADFGKVVTQGSRSKEKWVEIAKPDDLPFVIEKRYGRINLFTHGNGKYLGFGGRIVPNNVIFTQMLGADNFKFKLNMELLQKTRKILSSKTDHPLLMIYSCKTGTSQELLQMLADGLGIWVGGFTDSVIYHPYREGIGARVVDRESINAPETIYLSLGHPQADGRLRSKAEVKDFHQLEPQILVAPTR